MYTADSSVLSFGVVSNAAHIHLNNESKFYHSLDKDSDSVFFGDLYELMYRCYKEVHDHACVRASSSTMFFICEIDVNQ